MMNLLLNDVVINVQLGDEKGNDIETNTGAPQGDCLSAFFFILYLAKAIKPVPKSIEQQDYDQHLWSALDWMIDRDINKIEIDPKYSDDINFIRSSYPKINQLKREIPRMLKENGLEINTSKTEEYTIKINGDEKWRSCKVLGSLLDTSMDITTRHGLAASTYNKLQKSFKSKSISQKTKIRIFNGYITSTFLYNSELWTMSTALNNKIDCIQRRFLRKILGIHWPKTINNEKLYDKTKQKPWSDTVRRRAFSWLGHLLRLNHQTPARIALNEFIKNCLRPVGRPKETWMSMIKKCLKRNNININLANDEKMINDLERLCNDRIRWRQFVKNMKL